MRWHSMKDRQMAVVYDGADGTGSSYSNIKGWGIKEVPYMWDVRFDDCISSFKWNSIVPKKEIIEPFNVMASNSSNAFGLTAVNEGVNNSSEVQAISVSLNNSTAQTTTVETSDQHVVGVSASFTQTASAGVEGVASTSTSWTVAVNYSYTRTDTRSTSETKTIDLNITQAVNAPARTRYKATLLVTIGRLPATEYITTAQRWYSEPVTGGVIDPSNNNWYKRTEDVRINISGSLACTTNVNIQATPL
ncbi:ec95a42f-2efe-4242-9a4e-ccd9845474eb [Sclerotinia trifoliorum]|uniref:Ec95a42f-2efe-4242-9a4e-ccd9845474eb n=1 Tax=Sclerotinia trifoliorum TaxID=28548 RepID=A0A8H2VLZ8_9HELO|nr:ec95a42f-2efe-4242-9a4e-ccd9845474eb [Sclerotinia trifoliorum]